MSFVYVIVILPFRMLIYFRLDVMTSRRLANPKAQVHVRFSVKFAHPVIDIHDLINYN